MSEITMTKKLISIITSIIMCIGCFSISVSAKVIEPEFVKTESWTTSYYIDDDMDTLYPYIQCEADIYNDGTIKLYMWNTHEWDGFATVVHSVTVTQTIPSKKEIVDNIISLRYDTDGRFNPSGDNPVPDGFGDAWRDADYSYYDNLYEMENTRTQFWTEKYQTYDTCSPFSRYHPYYAIAEIESTKGVTGNKVYRPYLECYLPKLSSRTERDTIKPELVFKPTEDATGTYKFRLFGHDITITPELLSGNIISEPELTEQEKYIKQLEEENARLKASITNPNSFGDINGDSLVDVADAQMILNYYVYTLANSSAEPLEEWISKK